MPNLFSMFPPIGPLVQIKIMQPQFNKLFFLSQAAEL